MRMPACRGESADRRFIPKSPSGRMGRCPVVLLLDRPLLLLARASDSSVHDHDPVMASASGEAGSSSSSSSSSTRLLALVLTRVMVEVNLRRGADTSKGGKDSSGKSRRGDRNLNLSALSVWANLPRSLLVKVVADPIVGRVVSGVILRMQHPCQSNRGRRKVWRGCGYTYRRATKAWGNPGCRQHPILTLVLQRAKATEGRNKIFLVKEREGRVHRPCRRLQEAVDTAMMIMT
mmetsp:Transcript_18175/g.36593  ORF Transcript_18175/g.36593 Transcript_18175/m.36593 type:complete len:234 (+) Transcript_18175:361-1062(+)